MWNLFKKSDKAPGLTAEQLKSALSHPLPPKLIDIRSPEEYAQGHLPGAMSFPLDRLLTEQLPFGPEEFFILY